MIYDILVNKLEAGGFARGETVFLFTTPAEVSEAIELRAPLIGVPIDPFIAGWYKCRLQVICRHVSPQEVKILADTVQKLLTVESRETHPASEERGPAHIDWFFPQTLPIVFPRLESNHYETSQHFDAVFGFLPLE